MSEVKTDNRPNFQRPPPLVVPQFQQSQSPQQQQDKPQQQQQQSSQASQVTFTPKDIQSPTTYTSISTPHNIALTVSSHVHSHINPAHLTTTPPQSSPSGALLPTTTTTTTTTASTPLATTSATPITTTISTTTTTTTLPSHLSQTKPVMLTPVTLNLQVPGALPHPPSVTTPGALGAPPSSPTSLGGSVSASTDASLSPRVGCLSVGVVPQGLHSVSCDPPMKKHRRGVSKTTSSLKTNNRISLSNFPAGKRTIFDVVEVEPFQVGAMMSAGRAAKKVERKEGVGLIAKPGEEIAVFKAFSEGDPAEKVWLSVTCRGLFSVPRAELARIFDPNTVHDTLQTFEVCRIGRSRRNPQKHGTRPKPGMEMAECFCLGFPNDPKPLWVERSLVTQLDATEVAFKPTSIFKKLSPMSHNLRQPPLPAQSSSSSSSLSQQQQHTPPHMSAGSSPGPAAATSSSTALTMTLSSSGVTSSITSPHNRPVLHLSTSAQVSPKVKGKGAKGKAQAVLPLQAQASSPQVIQPILQLQKPRTTASTPTTTAYSTTAPSAPHLKFHFQFQQSPQQQQQQQAAAATTTPKYPTGTGATVATAGTPQGQKHVPFMTPVVQPGERGKLFSPVSDPLPLLPTPATFPAAAGAAGTGPGSTTATSVVAAAAAAVASSSGSSLNQFPGGSDSFATTRPRKRKHHHKSKKVTSALNVSGGVVGKAVPLGASSSTVAAIVSPGCVPAAAPGGKMRVKSPNLEATHYEHAPDGHHPCSLVSWTSATLKRSSSSSSTSSDTSAGGLASSSSSSSSTTSSDSSPTMFGGYGAPPEPTSQARLTVFPPPYSSPHSDGGGNGGNGGSGSNGTKQHVAAYSDMMCYASDPSIVMDGFSIGPQQSHPIQVQQHRHKHQRKRKTQKAKTPSVGVFGNISGMCVEDGVDGTGIANDGASDVSQHGMMFHEQSVLSPEAAQSHQQHYFHPVHHTRSQPHLFYSNNTNNTFINNNSNIENHANLTFNTDNNITTNNNNINIITNTNVESTTPITTNITTNTIIPNTVNNFSDNTSAVQLNDLQYDPSHPQMSAIDQQIEIQLQQQLQDFHINPQQDSAAATPYHPHQDQDYFIQQHHQHQFQDFSQHHQQQQHSQQYSIHHQQQHQQHYEMQVPIHQQGYQPDYQQNYHHQHQHQHQQGQGGHISGDGNGQNGYLGDPGYDPVVEGDSDGNGIEHGDQDRMMEMEYSWQDFHRREDFYECSLHDTCHDGDGENGRMFCIPNSNEYENEGFEDVMGGVGNDGNGMGGNVVVKREAYDEDENNGLGYGNGFLNDGIDEDDDEDMNASIQNIGGAHFFSGSNNDDLNGI